MRLKDKIAIIVGAGQSPGEGLGNGRATVLRFAQEGAKVMAVDNNLSSADETVAMARQSGGECIAFEADVTKEATRELRDSKLKLACLGLEKKRRPYAIAQKARKLQAGIEEIQLSLQCPCPSKYTTKHVRLDQERLD
jgi:hypothetical protein